MTRRRVVVLALGLLGCLLPLAARAADKPGALRYLRPEEEELVLESIITQSSNADGGSLVSVTERGKDKMTLSLTFGTGQRLTSAEVMLETPKTREQAMLKIVRGTAQLKREGGLTDYFKVAGNPVVTTAPDWSDVIQLVGRYDATQGGKQEFPGLWIHPSKPYMLLTFTVERVGADAIKVDDKKVQLQRYQIHLRSGDYLVWADATGRVYRLFPAGKPDKFVVLDGYADATRDLK